MQLLVKAVVSGAIIALASEIARRSSVFAAVLISLPLTSILALVWLYRDTHDTREAADLSWSILFVTAPSVVFFVVLPLMLRTDAGFWVSLLVACAVTALAYAAWLWGTRQLGFFVSTAEVREALGFEPGSGSPSSNGP